ncbi:kinase-like domain-containing protein [Boletus reticuloceps]|uniref:Kinase-like domain-containing protein n=1 Tax=Boletus reticuloceps TaxID=495285 RepID=A0A8I2YMW6_9AGAM|nr:kinase-like domain-containing protein [Boletus reticuloceps]
MYNLVTLVDVLSSKLAPSKQGYLHDIHMAASKVMSLSNEDRAQTMDETSMHLVFKPSTRTKRIQGKDDLGVFVAQDIQDILRWMNYKIEFISYGIGVPVVRSEILDRAGGKRRYLKFIKQDQEVKILKYLVAIQSPSNHTISGVQFWSVEGDDMILMPVAGGWLTSLKNRSKYLWSVALQLIEAVAFMHEHNVVHMDLKPQNVVIPPEGERLSIIDFSVSIHVRSADATYRGIVGTEEYVAAEVHEGQYKPMLADLWSCGRTLKEFCVGCNPSMNHATLLQISRQLMHQNPEAHPKISAVLE